MKLATTLADYKGYTANWAEAVREFEGTGFRYLDFDFYSSVYPGSPFLGKDWMREVEAAAEEAVRLGFTFVQAHSPMYNPLDPQPDHEARLLALKRSIEACGYLGIPNIVVHSGFSRDYPDPEGKSAHFRAAGAFHASLFPLMEKYGVNVLIENIDHWNMQGRYYFHTGGDMREFLDSFGHPLLHACWDVGHANIDGRPQDMDIRALGDHLRGLHIQDNFGEHDDHLAPFMGTLDLDQVVRGLLETGYGGYFTFEAINMISLGDGFHARKQAPGAAPRLNRPSLEMRRKAEALLYETGKYILTQYGCFEE